MERKSNTMNFAGRKINYRIYGKHSSDIILSLYEERDGEIARHEGVAYHLKGGGMFTLPMEAAEELATYGLFRRTINGGNLRVEVRLD